MSHGKVSSPRYPRFNYGHVTLGRPLRRTKLSFMCSGESKDWFLDSMRFLPTENFLKHSKDHAAYTSGFTFKLQNQPDAWALQGLWGCTSVIVMSRKRIFMSHIWQHPSMDKTDAEFMDQVFGPLENGNAACPGLKQYAGAGGDFENADENHVRAFIVTPCSYDPPYDIPDPNDLLFPDRVRQLGLLLGLILGRVPEPVIPYIIEASVARNRNWKWAQGKILIRYDPFATLGRIEGHDELSQMASTELWVEAGQKARYIDVWYPFQNQIWDELAQMCSLWDPAQRRLMRGRNVIKIREHESEKYGTLVQRGNTGKCSRARATPSITISRLATPKTSFTSVASSNTASSHVSSASSGIDSHSVPQSRFSSTPTATASTPPHPHYSRALTINIEVPNSRAGFGAKSRWRFYAADYGKAVHCDDEDIDVPHPYAPEHSLDGNKFPGGTWKLKMWDEDCEYKNSGDNLGMLFCGARQIRCFDDPSWIKGGKGPTAGDCLIVTAMSRIMCPY